jgi:hypothetical protein
MGVSLDTHGKGIGQRIGGFGVRIADCGGPDFGGGRLFWGGACDLVVGRLLMLMKKIGVQVLLSMRVPVCFEREILTKK